MSDGQFISQYALSQCIVVLVVILLSKIRLLDMLHVNEYSQHCFGCVFFKSGRSTMHAQKSQKT